MEITVKFNSLDEINEFINGVYIAPGMAQVAREEVKAEEVKAEPVEDVKEPEIKPEEDVKAEEPAEDVKAEELNITDLKKEARGLLAKVNKKTGTNTASEWIKELSGKSKLTEIEDAAVVASLIEKAKEVINAE